jgi:hypothetical protein
MACPKCGNEDVIRPIYGIQSTYGCGWSRCGDIETPCVVISKPLRRKLYQPYVHVISSWVVVPVVSSSVSKQKKQLQPY